jgi:uncharacterized glyoxalase superfamily protein PhnB
LEKTQFLTQAPVLLVKNIVASIDYWQKALGFHATTYGDTIDFAILRRDVAIIMLSQTPEGIVPVPNTALKGNCWNAYFWVDDAKAIYEEFTKNGAHIDYKLHEKPYGVLEFGIQDLDGHDIAFGQDL